MDREQLSLCFLKKGNAFLLINRNFPPFMGQWNAVGGHQLPSETIEECAIREIYEETNISVQKVELIATFTWNYDDGLGFIFISDLDEKIQTSEFPKQTKEGILDFKSIEWIEHPKNTGIIDDIKLFLIDIYQKKIRNVHYHLTYDRNRLIKVEVKDGLKTK